VNNGPSGTSVTWKRLRTMRWILAFVLMLAGGVAVLVGLPEVCEEQVAQTGEQGVVRTCHEPSATDPRFIAFLVLILMLVWPDLSELSVGMVKLTRRVEDQTKQTQKVGDEVRMLGLELRQTISQQVAQSQQVYINTAAAGEAEDVSTTPAPLAGAGLEAILRVVRAQPAYKRARIPEAWDTLDKSGLRMPRVALVGAAPDPALRDVEGLGDHLENTYVAAGASYTQVFEVGNHSIGHLLAIAPLSMVFPVSVLNANGGVSQGAIQEGLTAAFGWGPDVVLIGIGADASIPEVDHLLMRMLDSTFVVAPAGNSEFPAASWPARIPGVAGVAALDDKNKRSVFSNYGEGVDLAAPGVDVNSLLGVSNAGSLRLGDIGGTSIAADIVAGVAAFLLSRTKLKPVEVLPVLRRAATGPAADGLAILDASAATDLALQVAGQL
jgi:hypothetical protein